MLGGTTVRFALPPSLGGVAKEQADTLRPALTAALMGVATPEVYVAESYADLSLELLQGRADLAWAPPSVCARLEVHGGRALVQSVRAGVSRYRSALVCRADAPVSVEELSGKRAAWVDPDSTGGYLLAFAWLHAHGVDLKATFRRQRFAGSYEAALDAVIARDADLTAVFATAEDADTARTALDDLDDEEKAQLQIFGYTSETPNDGVVARPGLDVHLAESLAERLCEISKDERWRRALVQSLRADAFEPAPANAFAALHEIVLSTPR
jgi:phosphonate transport system substrate-binding protein